MKRKVFFIWLILTCSALAQGQSQFKINYFTPAPKAEKPSEAPLLKPQVPFLETYKPAQEFKENLFPKFQFQTGTTVHYKIVSKLNLAIQENQVFSMDPSVNIRAMSQKKFKFAWDLGDTIPWFERKLRGNNLYFRLNGRLPERNMEVDNFKPRRGWMIGGNLTLDMPYSKKK